MINILIVEDDREFGTKYVELLLKNHFQAYYCDTIEKAKIFLIENPVDIALIDLMLPPSYGSEGLDLLKFLIKKYPNIKPFLMTAKDNDTTEVVAEAMKLGARYFFDKSSTLFGERLILNIKELLMERKQNIFISHGHNEFLKLKLKDFLWQRLGKKPIILAEQPSRGLTVVEKLEKVSEDCSFAIILMTKDDEQKSGGLRASHYTQLERSSVTC